MAPTETKLSAAEVAPLARTELTGSVHVFVTGVLGVKVNDSKLLLAEFNSHERITLCG